MRNTHNFVDRSGAPASGWQNQPTGVPAFANDSE